MALKLKVSKKDGSTYIPTWSGVIEYDVYWINLISDRNYAVHTYKEALAEKIYKDLPSALIFFQKLLSAIQKAKAKENH